MKKYVLALALLVALSMMASAGQVNEKLGPYKLSFDLNITDPYNLVVYPAMAKETYAGTGYTEYQMEINDTVPPIPGSWSVKKHFLITIDHYESTFASIDRKTLESYDKTVYNRTIDGKDGFLIVQSFPAFPELNIFHLAYLLDPQTVVIAESGFPWDEGTLQLLKTIHIGKTT